MPSQIPIEFDLGSGDWFRLALADDILYDPTFLQPEYGTGIALDVESFQGVEPIPEPAGLSLLLIVAAILQRRRNRFIGTAFRQ